MQIALDNHLVIELEYDGDKASVISSPYVSKDVVIPTSIQHDKKGYIIDKIESGAFKNNKQISTLTFLNDTKLRQISKDAFRCSSIKKLKIPSTIENLEEGFCSYTNKLQTISIPSSNKHFRYSHHKYLIQRNFPNGNVLLFVRRTIIAAVIPKYVTRIGENAFNGCENLKTLSFQEGSKLREIAKCAFENTSLQKITLPSNLEELEEGWCMNAMNLIEISVPSNHKTLSFVGNKYLIYRNSILLFARRDITQATIPLYVKRIGDSAFENCRNLKYVMFSPHLTKTQLKSAKYSMEASDLSASQSQVCLEEIGNRAFFGCVNLKRLEPIPANVKCIGSESFANCDMKLLELIFASGSKLRTIGYNAFSNCTKLAKLIIPSKDLDLEEGWCNGLSHLDHFAISPENPTLKYIDDALLIKTLNNTNEKAVNNHEEILLFVSKDVKELMVPSTITRVGEYSLAHCRHLLSLKFPKNSKLKSIGKRALDCCFWLRNIELPASLEEIDEDWSEGVDQLVSLSLDPANPHFVFLDGNFLIKRGKALKKMEYQKKVSRAPSIQLSPEVLQNHIQQNNITADDSNIKSDNGSLSSSQNSENSMKHDETHPASTLSPKVKVKDISDDDSCSSDTNYSDSDNPSDEESENSSSNITQPTDDIVQPPQKIETTVVDLTQQSEKSAKQPTETDSLELTPNDETVLIFARRDITVAVIPAYITRIASKAFCGCVSLWSVQFESSESNPSCLKEIGSKAFCNCQNLRFITHIPSSVEYIADGCFSLSRNLQFLEFMATDVIIGPRCFYQCKSLSLIGLPNTKVILFDEESLVDVSYRFALAVDPHVDIKFEGRVKGDEDYSNKCSIM